MSPSATRRHLSDDRSARPRAGWLVVMCLMVAVLGAVVVFAAAWVLGGRAVSAPASVEALAPADGGVGSPATSAPAGASEPLVQADGTAQLPGALTTTTVHELRLDHLDDLKPLGWTVGHLVDFGFGFEPQRLETGVVDGVRTVELQLADGADRISVAETRPESEDVGLTSLREKLAPILDEDLVEHHRVTLGTGEGCDLFVSRAGDRWTAAVETDDAQYVITSNLAESSAEQVADWVMASDRARVQMLPTDPSARDRLARGLDELFRWND